MAIVQEFIITVLQIVYIVVNKFLQQFSLRSFIPLTSHEAHFNLLGTFNRQKPRYWTGNNLRELHKNIVKYTAL